MIITPNILLIPFYSILNRARGNQLFGLADSTEISRIVAMLLMALAAAITQIDNANKMAAVFIWLFISLLFWCTPGWDEYWSAEIGNNLHHSRLWGLATMTLRMTLAAPALIVLAILVGNPDNAIYSLGVLLLGFPYYIFGYIVKANMVAYAEYTVGAILGLLVILIL